MFGLKTRQFQVTGTVLVSKITKHLEDITTLHFNAYKMGIKPLGAIVVREHFPHIYLKAFNRIIQLLNWLNFARLKMKFCDRKWQLLVPMLPVHLHTCHSGSSRSLAPVTLAACQLRFRREQRLVQTGYKFPTSGICLGFRRSPSSAAWAGPTPRVRTGPSSTFGFARLVCVRGEIGVRWLLAL